MGYPLWEAGEEARKSGDYEKAISRFDEARALGYLAPVLYKSYSMTYGKLKDIDNEIEILEEGIDRLKNAVSNAHPHAKKYSTGIKDLETRLDKAKKKKTLH